MLESLVGGILGGVIGGVIVLFVAFVVVQQIWRD